MGISDELADLTDSLGYPVDETAPLDLADTEAAISALRSLARVREQAADVKQVADAERARITEWANRRLETIAAKERWYLTGLESYARARNADDPKLTTLSYPAGTLRLRKAPVAVRADSVEELQAQRPDLVRIRLEVDKAEVKARLTAGPVVDTDENGCEVRLAVDPDGVIIPGVSLIVAPEARFTVQV